MNKTHELDSTPAKRAFKAEIQKVFGDKPFTVVEGKTALKNAGHPESKWDSIYLVLRKACNVGRGIYSIGNLTGNGVVVTTTTNSEQTKEALKRDMEIISSTDEVAEKWEEKAKRAKASFQKPKTITKVAEAKPQVTLSLIPKKDPQYVTWGHFKDIKLILESNIFYPIFVTGLSGNGKTSMIREVCAKLKRDMIRVNITVETDEDDLLGGFRLIDGETVWQDGPLVVAMKQGAIALIDEVDLASHKIMCLQPIMEGQPIYLKKINEVVYPQPGFNIVATANTKGKGSDDGRFMGTNILNEAFLDRFSATFYQEYPSPAQEAKILKKQFAMHEIQEDSFVDNLVKWADVIRRSFKEGAVDEIITTRRLIDITKTFSIFKDKMKSVVLCLERFDDETRESFVDFYTKVDAGVSMDDLMNNEPEIEEVEEEEKEDEAVPF
jgi:MoxR-like ATPase